MRANQKKAGGVCAQDVQSDRMQAKIYRACALGARCLFSFFFRKEKGDDAQNEKGAAASVRACCL